MNLSFSSSIIMVITTCYLICNIYGEGGSNRTGQLSDGLMPDKAESTQKISFETLLLEMCDPRRLAHYPSIEYHSLQASSYNRESVSPDKPGWFADSDGVSYIRKETNNGRTEYVIMEHNNPGCITRMWTPFMYYGMDNRIGPNVRIYLDGSSQPVIEENFIALLTGKGTIHAPFANLTARAGVSILPIPYAKSCKITLDDKPFYNIINYREYKANPKVITFSKRQLDKTLTLRNMVAERLITPQIKEGTWSKSIKQVIEPGGSLKVDLPRGNNAVKYLSIQFEYEADLKFLRSTIMKFNFDGNQTVWCPVGDFFCSADTIYEFNTWGRRVEENGKMICTWMMPYETNAEFSLKNLQEKNITAEVEVKVDKWKWDEQSMYFHSNWIDVGPLPGDKFVDLNFIDIVGKGRIVGDALTVLSPSTDWWGEGDEKIYIDEKDIDQKFPSHFGTGTEDYYGWAGGVVPTGEDYFSFPFGANVRIGNSKDPRGYNICTRSRILDDIPFEERLVLDMEASPGVGIRNYWNLLSYSMVTFWYAVPGAISNRPPRPDLAEKDILSLAEIDRLEDLAKDSTIIFNYSHLIKKCRDLIAK